MSSARSSMASATRCSSFFRVAAGMSRQDLKASAAAVAARSMSSALPRATDRQHRAVDRGFRLERLARDRRHGLAVDHVADAFGSSVWRAGARRGRGWPETRPSASTLSMGRLHFQGFVDVVALPAGFLVVDLHVERQREFAVREHRIEIGRQRLEDMFAGLLAGRRGRGLRRAAAPCRESRSSALPSAIA